jgi:hypothetical protein
LTGLTGITGMTGGGFLILVESEKTLVLERSIGGGSEMKMVCFRVCALCFAYGRDSRRGGHVSDIKQIPRKFLSV